MALGSFRLGQSAVVLPIVEPWHDVAGPAVADAEPVGPVVVHAERPVAVAADDALEPFARLHFAVAVADVLNEQEE